jgi:hypothetical protein
MITIGVPLKIRACGSASLEAVLKPLRPKSFVGAKYANPPLVCQSHFPYSILLGAKIKLAGVMPLLLNERLSENCLVCSSSRRKKNLTGGIHLVF